MSASPSLSAALDAQLGGPRGCHGVGLPASRPPSCECCRLWCPPGRPGQNLAGLLQLELVLRAQNGALLGHS